MDIEDIGYRGYWISRILDIEDILRRPAHAGRLTKGHVTAEDDSTMELDDDSGPVGLIDDAPVVSLPVDTTDAVT
eukprot:COSAG01_NODE_1202_length_11263_cov_64.078466_1_plen_75_part_00